MCLAIPMMVVSVEGETALVSLEGLEKEIDVRFLKDPVPGDYVIVHAGFAIEKLDPEEAEKTLDLFREIGRIPDGRIQDSPLRDTNRL